MNTNQLNLITSAIIILLVLTTFTSASFLPQTVNQKLHQAQQLIRNAAYDQGIEILTELADFKELPRDILQQVYMELGYAYTAKRLLKDVKVVLGKMLELEPPPVRLQPEKIPPPMMKAYYEVRKELTNSYQDSLWLRPSPGIKTIALLDFAANISEADQKKWGHIGKGFAEMLMIDLSRVTKLQVVERERINWLLKEIEMENDPKRFDETTAVRLGKLLGVHAVYFGSLTKVGNQIIVGGRLVQTETGKWIKGDYVKGKPNKIWELSQQLAGTIVKDLDLKISKIEEKELKSTRATSSLEADLAYSEGLAYLDQQDYENAYKKFLEALKHDPGYEKARARAESIKPVIG